jgi:hypothetical protein
MILYDHCPTCGSKNRDERGPVQLNGVFVGECYSLWHGQAVLHELYAEYGKYIFVVDDPLYEGVNQLTEDVKSPEPSPVTFDIELWPTLVKTPPNNVADTA